MNCIYVYAYTCIEMTVADKKLTCNLLATCPYMVGSPPFLIFRRIIYTCIMQMAEGFDKWLRKLEELLHSITRALSDKDYTDLRRLCEEDPETLSENEQLEYVVQLHKQSILLMVDEIESISERLQGTAGTRAMKQAAIDRAEQTIKEMEEISKLQNAQILVGQLPYQFESMVIKKAFVNCSKQYIEKNKIYTTEAMERFLEKKDEEMERMEKNGFENKEDEENFQDEKKNLKAVKMEWETLEHNVLSKLTRRNKSTIKDVLKKNREAVVHPHVDISTIWEHVELVYPDIKNHKTARETCSILITLMKQL